MKYGPMWPKISYLSLFCTPLQKRTQILVAVSICQFPKNKKSHKNQTSVCYTRKAMIFSKVIAGHVHPNTLLRLILNMYDRNFTIPVFPKAKWCVGRSKFKVQRLQNQRISAIFDPKSVSFFYKCLSQDNGMNREHSQK